MAKGRPDFSPTAVDVVLRPEWAAEEGNDKSLTATISLIGSIETTVLTYTVPTGKVFYIDDIDFVTTQDATWKLKEGATVIWQMHAVADNALSRIFTTPKKFDAGAIINVTCKHDAGVNSSPCANIGGREYTV